LITLNTKTLGDLRDAAKRRVRQLAAQTSVSVEIEEKVTFSNHAIYDAINDARSKVARLVPSARQYVIRKKCFETDENVQEYAADCEIYEIISVWYDTESDGSWNNNTVLAYDVVSAEGEQMAIENPFDTPSAAKPKYRLTNRGLRLITSEDGTVVAGKYVTVEFVGEPDLLANSATCSGWSDTLNTMVVDVAIGILCAEILPELSQIAFASFAQMAMAGLKG
jgi:hypothetical protein